MEETASPTKEMSKNLPLFLGIGVVIVLAIVFVVGRLFFLSPSYVVTLVNAPTVIDAGTVATFTWDVTGAPTTIHHTAVHLGLQSQPEDLGTDVAPQQTIYTETLPDFANGTFAIPLRFVGNITLPAPGLYYYRVHAVANEKHYWSAEYVLEVKAAP